jgi:hypothetical protein
LEDAGVKHRSTLHCVYNPDRFGRFYLEEYMVLSMKTRMEKSDGSRTRRDEQMRKYSKMDKRVKDKLFRSPRENGGE